MLSHHHGIAANNVAPAHSSSQSSSQPTCEWEQCHLFFSTCTTWKSNTYNMKATIAKKK